MESLYAAIMGVVEGLTEFLPISSTGHLILTDHLLGFQQLVGEDFAKAFEVIIQLGAILAIVAAYPHRFLGLLNFSRRKGVCRFSRHCSAGNHIDSRRFVGIVYR